MAYLIYLISFLEWFTTLSIEIIAIRNFTPIIWTNSISTSIILWVILLALSYWYYIWWKISKWKSEEFLKNKIIYNLSFAGFYYLFLTFTIDTFLLDFLLKESWNYFISILLSSTLLFFIPVFLASQTIPLLSEMLKWDNTWEKIWKLLFFSTIWSFLGSVLTSSLLFATIWVAKTWTLNSIILSSIALVLCFIWFKKISFKIIFSFLVLVFALTSIIAKTQYIWNIIFAKSNSYHNIYIIEDGEWKRIFSQNLWYSSGIDIKTKESYFNYIKEIKSQILNWNYENIAIIWAAWFTLPQELSKENKIKNIDVIDVDPELKDISEKYFLQEKISKKVNFIPESARYFINKSINENKKYDAIVIDIYIWKSLPAQTLTYEFYKSLTQISDDIFINIITDRDMKSEFSKRLLKTMFQAFWNVEYKDVNAYTSMSKNTNFVVTNKETDWYKKYSSDENENIYTDDKNSIEIDLYKMN